MNQKILRIVMISFAAAVLMGCKRHTEEVTTITTNLAADASSPAAPEIAASSWNNTNSSLVPTNMTATNYPTGTNQ